MVFLCENQVRCNPDQAVPVGHGSKPEYRETVPQRHMQVHKYSYQIQRAIGLNLASFSGIESLKEKSVEEYRNDTVGVCK